MGVGLELLKFAGIGAKVAVRRVLGQEDSERFLVDALSGMPGAPAKIGQLLGMRDAHLIPAPDAMPLEAVKRILSDERPTLAEAIESISPWSKTASMGQTHQALLKDGRLVAIKIQYPGVAKALSDQIEAIFGVARLSPARRYDFDIGQTKAFLRQKLLEETDYRMEAQTQERFFRYYRGSPVIVPEVYPQFSTATVLTQSWEESTALEEMPGERAGKLCAEAGAVMTRLLLDSVMGLGLIHTDLNPGNYGFRVQGDTVKLVVYDFGSSYQLPSGQGLQLYRWLQATRLADPNAVWSALTTLGFSAKHLEPIATKLLILSQGLLAPFLTDGSWVAKNWRLQEQMDDILGSDKWWFRTAGPPWFLYLMRTFQGWHHALKVLDAAIPVAKIWWPWEQQCQTLVQFMGVSENTPIKPIQASGPLFKASSLRVCVTDGGSEVVDLTLPARAVEDLESLVPDAVMQKCRIDGIDLRAISERVVLEGGAAQELFSACIGPRQYRVWLA
jgi:hypothetical protein